MATAKKSANAKVSAKNKTPGDRACWPGFQRVPGTKAGSKGSCAPKEHATKSEKRADSRAAAASRREKAA